MKKSWIEKRDCEKSFKIKTIDKKFADIPEGSKMLIVSPPIIDEYVKSITYGKFVELIWRKPQWCDLNNWLFRRPSSNIDAIPLTAS